MTSIGAFAERRPYLFVIAVFVVQSLLPLPLVVIFKIAGFDLLPLRLIAPAVESVFVIWLIWHLGWFARSGFTTTVRNVHLYWYPALVAFVPLMVYGSVAIPPGLLTFYLLALVFTGISEEGLARGVLVPALLSRGKWVALFFAGALFSASHITNLFFEDFNFVEWFDKFFGTFGFAILYGAVFLRTGNIWPLMFLHAVDDLSFVTSGTAGPFLKVPMASALNTGVSIASIAYGMFIMRGVQEPAFQTGSQPAEGGRPGRA